MAASSLQPLVDDFVKNESHSASTDIRNGVLAGTYSLLQLVESLGPHLTSTESANRVQGTRLLSDIVEKLSGEQLKQKEVALLLAFYIDRLKDHHSVTPHVLRGISVLARHPQLSADGATTILQELSREVHAQSLTAADRRYLYNVVTFFLQERVADIQPLGADFVCGFIQTMDGEKDPQNLLLAFQCVRIIAQNFQLGVFVEELFEVVACYFPVEYNPTSTTAENVDREELSERLRLCLTASSKFSEYCLPLLLEKLTSSVTSAKTESLHTLTAGAEVFGMEGLKEFHGSLWSCIRREIFSAVNDTLHRAALSALTAMVTALSNDITEKNKEFEEFIDRVFEDTIRYLREPTQQMIGPSSQALQAVAQGSYPASQKVISRVVPLLLEQFHVSQQATLKKGVLEVLLQFIKISGEMWQNRHVDFLLAEYRDSIFTIFVSLLCGATVELRSLALSGLAQMLGTPNMVLDTERPLVAEHFVRTLLGDRNHTVRDDAVTALASMAAMSPSIVKDTALPMIVSQLNQEPNIADENHDVESLATHEFLLNAVATVSAAHVQVAMEIMPTLVHHLEQLLTENSTPGGVLHEAEVTCHCLHRVTCACVTDISSMQYLCENLLPKCVSILVQGALVDCSGTERLVTNSLVVERVSSIVQIVVENLDTASAKDVISTMTEMFLDSKLDCLGGAVQNCNTKFQPLQTSSPWQQTQLVMLLMATICAGVKEANVLRWSELIEGLLSIATQCCHLVSSTSAAKCVGGLVNKLSAGAELDQLVETIRRSTESEIERASLAPERRCQALTLWTWCTKALVLRSHTQQTVFAEKLIDWLDDPHLCKVAVEAFPTVLSESHDILSSAMHADIKIMYRQRFFLMTLAKLVKCFHLVDNAQKQYHLTALSSLLKFMPKQVLIAELPPLLPLLVQSLHSQQVALLLSTLNTLNDLIAEMPDMFTRHVDDFLPRLLDLTQFRPNMKVRVGALQCLTKFTALPEHVVLPQQDRVTRHLAAALDDHKRLVRQEAVNARTQWILLGAPIT
ncbi:MMS19 nucleotide excision repair protein [Lamellibrachia satsuma]|nr:MMS19 nucleotide excision repair protein [Lamellibrachia satsuma]